MELSIFNWLLPSAATLGAAVSAVAAAVLAFYQVRRTRQIQSEIGNITHEFLESTRSTYKMIAEFEELQPSIQDKELKSRVDALIKKVRELEQKRVIVTDKVNIIADKLSRDPKTAAFAQEIAAAAMQNFKAGQELLEKADELEDLIERTSGSPEHSSNQLRN